MAPESYDSLPPGFVEGIFHKVTKQEIKAPITTMKSDEAQGLSGLQKNLSDKTINFLVVNISQFWNGHTNFDP